MVKILIDLPDEVHNKVWQLQAKWNLLKKADTIIKIIREFDE